MNHPLDSLLARYSLNTLQDYERALREVIQELALLGLWRAKFYEHAAFYGGTALRVFHGLPRFSEDLDFSLTQPLPGFSLEPFLSAIRDELEAYGFEFQVEKKTKATDSAVESAFIKGGTRINLLRIGTPEFLSEKLPRLQLVRVKLEIDTNPPPNASFEIRTRLVPIPFQVRLYDLPSLLAGKLHAVLCRNWKGRIKGRDWYDLVWYAGRAIQCNLDHLAARMRQTGHRVSEEPMTLQELKTELDRRIDDVDFEAAKADVQPFIVDAAELALWGKPFFREIAQQLCI